MMEGPRHQHLHQEWQEPLEERSACRGLPVALQRRGVGWGTATGTRLEASGTSTATRRAWWSWCARSTLRSCR